MPSSGEDPEAIPLFVSAFQGANITEGGQRWTQAATGKVAAKLLRKNRCNRSFMWITSAAGVVAEAPGAFIRERSGKKRTSSSTEDAWQNQTLHLTAAAASVFRVQHLTGHRGR